MLCFGAEGYRSFPSESHLKYQVSVTKFVEILVSNFQPGAWDLMKDASSKTVNAYFLILMLGFEYCGSTFKTNYFAQAN